MFISVDVGWEMREEILIVAYKAKTNSSVD